MNRVLRGLLAPLLILLYWQLLASSGLVSPYLLPAPGKVWNTTVLLWDKGILAKHLAASLTRIAAGFSLSCLLAFAMAALVRRFRLLAEFFAAPLDLLRMIPPLAVIPLLILWLGIGTATQLAIIILASFFPVFMNTLDGLARVSPEHRELGRSLNLSRRAFVLAVVIPSAVPSIVTGLRLAFGYSWRALIGAELIAASSGLGYMIVNAQEMLRTDEVIAGILVIGVVGWLLDTAFTRGTTRLLARRFPELAA